MGRSSVEELFAGDSEIGALMRSHFASATENVSELKAALGPVETWSSNLKNAFSILLNSCCPMFLVWDCKAIQNSLDERILFYNDAYLSLLKATQQLLPFGRSVKDSWTKEWSQIRLDVEQVFTTGQAIQRQQEPFSKHQTGSTDEQLYTWSYSAIWDETGQIKGVFATGCRAAEETGLALKEPLQDVQERQPPHQASQVQIAESPLQQAEAALRASEVRFQAFMSYSPTSAWIADQAGRLLYLSPTYFQMFQLPQQDAMGKQIRDIYSEEFAQQFLENNSRVFETGQVIETVETAPRPDGSIGSFLVYKFPIAQASGEMLLGGVAVDITERKRTEEVLQRREEELRLLTNALPALIAYVDKDHCYRFNNRMYETWFGQSAADLAGKPLREVLGETAYEAVRPYVEQALSGERVSFERQMSYRGGNTRYIKADYVPHINSRDEVEGFFSLVSDITDRKQAEEVLRRSEEQFRRLGNAMPQIVWTTNAHGELDYVSQQWTDYTGLTLEQTQDREQYVQVIHPDDVPQLYQQWLEAVQSGSPFQTEIRIKQESDSSYRWFLTRAVPVKTEQGQVIAWYGTSTDIDDRKRTEAALQQSEQRLQLAQQASRIGTWEWNLLTNEVTWSDGIWTLLALEPNSITPSLESFTRFIYPDDREPAFQRVEAALAQGDDYYDEFRVVRQDGVICWLLSKGRVIRTPDGQPERILGINVDISDRKQAEEALRNSAERLGVALAAAKLGDWSWSAATDIVTFSEQAAEMFGIPPGPYMTWTQMQTLLHADDRERAYLQVERAVAEQSDYDIEYRVIHTNGTERWIAAKGRAQYDSLGQVLGMLGVVQDITSRKQAEAEREHLLAREQSANQTLQRFIEHTPVAVVMLDRDMRYLFASHRWMREYAPGYTNLKGLSHYEVMTDVPESWREVHQRCLAGATERCEEDYYLRSDGSALWLHWEVLPWYASADEIGGIIIFAENVTERKQAAQEREKLLEREQGARREAEQANRIKDEFLAVLSHELRSPLNPILGWAKLLQSRQFDESATARALETIERNAKLQTQLIDDLLDVSRILRGKMVLDVCPVNLVTVTDAALETVRLSAEAKNIAVEKAVASNIGLISGDAARLQQIVWNLLTNAVKFTPSGGTVEIRLEQSKTHAKIQVKDTGKGISAEFLPHVFEYFRQEDGTTTRKFGGLGLGLAIVRYLTEQHGGTVQAESPGEGLGATFTVKLPLIRTRESGGGNREHPTSLSLPAPHLPLAELQILVVDDDSDMRELMSTILEQAGAQTKMASSAIEALEVLKEFKPDIVVSDIGMPEMDGYELLRQIRSRWPKQSRQVPAIALTAYAGDINRQQALAAGFQSHIAKPVEPAELVKAILTLMKSR